MGRCLQLSVGRWLRSREPPALDGEPPMHEATVVWKWFQRAAPCSRSRLVENSYATAANCSGILRAALKQVGWSAPVVMMGGTPYDMEAVRWDMNK